MSKLMMRYTNTVVIIILSYSCNNKPNNNAPKSDTLNKIIVTDTAGKNSLPGKKEGLREFRYRLNITGDFDGDGTTDTIFESYISQLTGKETFKILDSIDWDNNVALIIKNRPISRLYSSIAGTDTFIVTKNYQQSGISFFQNLGDLNNDKGDELGYVINWDDYSNINTYYIITLTKNKKWKPLLSFQINEQLNFEIENLYNGSSIIKKEGTNKIKYKFYSDSATIEEGEKHF